MSQDRPVTPPSSASHPHSPSAGPRFAQETVGPFVLGPTLGKGQTAKVRLGIHKDTGFKVAIKIINKKIFTQDVKQRARVEREVAILKMLDHPHVMRLYDVWETRRHLFIVVENAEGGELFDYIVARDRLKRHEALRFFAQIVQALEYCHSYSICHRDLKPENILLDANNNVKIADFGMATLMKYGAHLNTSCGSPHYTSPEVCYRQKYDGRVSDVWSAGVILFAEVTGHLPFDHEDVITLMRIIRTGIYSIPDYVDPDIADLIRRMLVVDPAKRIRIWEIKHHPCFQSSPMRPLSSYNISDATNYRPFLFRHASESNVWLAPNEHYASPYFPASDYEKDRDQTYCTCNICHLAKDRHQFPIGCLTARAQRDHIDMQSARPVRSVEEIDISVVDDLAHLGWGTRPELVNMLMSNTRNLEQVFYHLLVHRKNQRARALEQMGIFPTVSAAHTHAPQAIQPSTPPELVMPRAAASPPMVSNVPIRAHSVNSISLQLQQQQQQPYSPVIRPSPNLMAVVHPGTDGSPLTMLVKSPSPPPMTLPPASAPASSSADPLALATAFSAAGDDGVDESEITLQTAQAVACCTAPQPIPLRSNASSESPSRHAPSVSPSPPKHEPSTSSIAESDNSSETSSHPSPPSQTQMTVAPPAMAEATSSESEKVMEVTTLPQAAAPAVKPHLSSLAEELAHASISHGVGVSCNSCGMVHTLQSVGSPTSSQCEFNRSSSNTSEEEIKVLHQQGRQTSQEPAHGFTGFFQAIRQKVMGIHHKDSHDVAALSRSTTPDSTASAPAPSNSNTMPSASPVDFESSEGMNAENSDVRNELDLGTAAFAMECDSDGSMAVPSSVSTDGVPAGFVLSRPNMNAQPSSGSPSRGGNSPASADAPPSPSTMVPRPPRSESPAAARILDRLASAVDTTPRFHRHRASASGRFRSPQDVAASEQHEVYSPISPGISKRSWFSGVLDLAPVYHTPQQQQVQQQQQLHQHSVTALPSAPQPIAVSSGVTAASQLQTQFSPASTSYGSPHSSAQSSHWVKHSAPNLGGLMGAHVAGGSADSIATSPASRTKRISIQKSSARKPTPITTVTQSFASVPTQ